MKNKKGRKRHRSIKIGSIGGDGTGSKTPGPTNPKEEINRIEETEGKINRIDFNFYKSEFPEKSPYKINENIILNKTGLGVVSDLYGVEELFPIFKDEVEYLRNPTNYDLLKKFKPYKKEKIILKQIKNPSGVPVNINFFDS